MVDGLLSHAERGARVLVVGGGAREHALVRALVASPSVAHVLCAPGNAGIALEVRTLAITATDVDALVRAATEERITLAVIGPEAPLVAGLADALRARGVRVFGPSRAASELEGSKIFSKLFMVRHRIPTAPFEVFEDPDAAEGYVRAAGRNLVIKADGLAAGKGVVVAKSADEACEAIDQMMRKRVFGDAGARVLIEDILLGEEISYHVISDGERFVSLAAAQDHKRLLDGDQGPNTGGMGAYSPPPVFTAALEAEVVERVVRPTLDGMRAEGRPFVGALFIGLMIVDGRPMVLEYNVRFGDPETEVMLPRIDGDLFAWLDGAARGALPAEPLRWHAGAALCVVLAARGYPGKAEEGAEIPALDAAAETEGAALFHAGTALRGGRVIAAGGRVLVASARGSTIDDAATRAYGLASRARFEGSQMRTDIGWRARQGVKGADNG